MVQKYGIVFEVDKKQWHNIKFTKKNGTALFTFLEHISCKL